MRKKLFFLLFFIITLPVILIIAADLRRADGQRVIDKTWQTRSGSKIGQFGSTSSIEILPLVNWHAKTDEYLTEPGVSYLIRTDSDTILFDLGYNRFNQSPSPLEHNMSLAGVALSDIETIFISHAHRDHVGGAQWAQSRTFSFGTAQVPLDNVSVYAPIPMTYPGLDIETISSPQVISNGIASTGPIARELFIGRIDEQALVINLSDKGLVVIVGCGHQTVPKLLQRIEEVFEIPLYAIIGDLHYPVPEGRWKVAHIDAQRQLASGNGIFAPIDQETVEKEVSVLDEKVKFLAIGGHDTSDRVIRMLGKRFGDRFSPVRVGQPIRLGHTRVVPKPQEID